MALYSAFVVLMIHFIAQGSLCVASGAQIPASCVLACYWSMVSLILGYQPITNHNTTGGDVGATTWGPATHRDLCDRAFLIEQSLTQIYRVLHKWQNEVTTSKTVIFQHFKHNNMTILHYILGASHPHFS